MSLKWRVKVLEAQMALPGRSAALEVEQTTEYDKLCDLIDQMAALLTSNDPFSILSEVETEPSKHAGAHLLTSGNWYAAFRVFPDTRIVKFSEIGDDFSQVD